MSKYRVLMYVENKHDTRLEEDSYDTVNEAVKAALEYGTTDFRIVQIVEWKMFLNEDNS